MGSSKKQTVGYFYDKDLAGVLCHGPVDAITQIECSDRVILRQNVDSTSKVYINAEKVFGGKDREGGVSGYIDVMMGDDNQLPNAYMQSKISTAVNAMRGVVSVVWNRLYVGMNPYMRDFKYRVKRVNTGWYPEKSEIYTYSINDQIGWDYALLPFNQNPGYEQLIPPESGWESGGFPPFTHENKWLGQFTLSVFWIKKRITITGGDISSVLKVYADNGCVVWINNQYVGAVNRDNIPVAGNQNNPLEFTFGAAGSYDILIKAYTEALEIDQAGNFLDIEIDLTPIVDTDINPAHIIRDVLTNTRYGLGVPEIKIDDVAFTKMADTLYSENLGVSILWDGSSAIEDFLNTICAHICATMPYVDSESGLWTCKLLRDDYDVNALISLNEYNVIKCSEFTRKTMVDLINTVTVNYWDRETGDTGTVTVDNTARIAQQGKVIAQQVDYNGFTNAEVASRVALRDLKTLSTPLASATLDVKEIAGGLKVGDCFKWSWSDYGLNNAIMRVSSIKRSGVLTNYVTIECIEDSYSMPMQSVLPYVPPPASNFEDAKPVDGILVESPYFELVQRYGQTFVYQQLDAENESGYVLAVATTTQNAINADMNISSGGDFEDVGVVDLLPPCLTTQEISRIDSSFIVSDFSAFSSIAAGSYFKINNELMRFDSILSNVVSVGRGVLDTTPQIHQSGSKIFMIDEFSTIDETLYFEGQTIAGKLLTNTGSDVLDLSEAPTITTIMNSRAFRPYPPANVKINGEYWPAEIETDLSISWVDRNRIQQTSSVPVDWYDGGIVIEPNTSNHLILIQYDENDIELATNSANVTGTNNYTFLISAMQPDTMSIGITLKTIRDGYECLYPFLHKVELSTFFSAPYDISYTVEDI